MKNLLTILLLAAAIWFGWMWLFLNFIPDKTSDKWVGETRLGIDNGVLGATFTYVPPINEPDMIIPKRGISPDFRMTRLDGPKAWHSADSHVIRYRVSFTPSPAAPPGPSTQTDYILVIKSSGPYILPSWKTVLFIPEKLYERRMEKEARLKAKEAA